MGKQLALRRLVATRMNFSMIKSHPKQTQEFNIESNMSLTRKSFAFSISAGISHRQIPVKIGMCPMNLKFYQLIYTTDGSLSSVLSVCFIYRKHCFDFNQIFLWRNRVFGLYHNWLIAGFCGSMGDVRNDLLIMYLSDLLCKISDGFW